jgi:hypothetical protein
MWKRSEGLFRRFPTLRWLYPGMRVKRYALVAALGVLLLALGLAPLLPALPLWPWALGLLGLLLLVGGIRAMNRSLLSALTEPEEVPERVYVRRRLERGPKVVAFGGGTGLSRMLRGLKEHTTGATAIVAVTDDGGSTGRLRLTFGLPAVGDLVDCLAALSDHPALAQLLAHRFDRGEMRGHTFGNLFLVTLYQVAGDFAEAILEANAILNLRGQVLPATPEAVRLKARFHDGEEVEGEVAISFPVAFDPRPFAVDGVRVVEGDFREEGPLAQHDPRKVVEALLSLV